MTDTLPLTLAARNDAFRTRPGVGWVATDEVAAKGPAFIVAAMRAVAAFDDFHPGNDPHGEHDFGAFTLAGQSLFWKIDYYDRDLRFGSPDPADPAVTRRILTIMLASEY